MGKMVSLVVNDAYEDGHGRLVAKAGGVVPLMKSTGQEADKAELQRYLSAVAICPAMLVNHASLVREAVGFSVVRLRDARDPTGATVDIEVSGRGEPIACHAERPRLVGRMTVLTPWRGDCSGFSEWEGMRMATRLAVRWELAEGPFEYYRSEITSFARMD